MNDSQTQNQELITDQAGREATGAHPYGRFLEEFEVGAVYKHWPAKTVTEADDHLFCLLTMNHHPLHINDVYAQQSQQGQNVVVGPLVYSLALGMSVSDVSGKAIANLATEELKQPAPARWWRRTAASSCSRRATASAAAPSTSPSATARSLRSAASGSGRRRTGSPRSRARWAWRPFPPMTTAITCSSSRAGARATA